uniref:Tudor domain-containing protein n=1 Tax=Panagrolaimus sp. PS1159 TaxID=55785 RepID=A0AC35EYD2_9BILA
MELSSVSLREASSDQSGLRPRMMKPRSISPFLKDSEDKDQTAKVLIIEKPKIQRIRCRQNYNAVVTNVISPSEIWIQILNNISDKLVIPASDAPMLEKDLIENQYVMTPINEDTLVRGRILETVDGKVLIRLIDHGSAVWRDANAVFKMSSPKDQLYCFPWQSKVVMLHGVKPKNQVEWTNEETDALKRVLVDFDYVYVKPALADYRYINDDNYASSVSMIGMNGPLQQSKFDDVNGCRIPPESSGIDIAEMYHMYASSTSRCLTDGRDQEYYNYPNAFEHVYFSTYKPFNIAPNPNDTYQAVPLGFKDDKTEKVKEKKTEGYVYLTAAATKKKNSEQPKVGDGKAKSNNRSKMKDNNVSDC